MKVGNFEIKLWHWIVLHSTLLICLVAGLLVFSVAADEYVCQKREKEFGGLKWGTQPFADAPTYKTCWHRIF